MTTLSSGEVRRRKNPKKANPGISISSSSNNNDSSTEHKRRRPDNDPHRSADIDNFGFGFGSSANNTDKDSAPSKKEYDEYAWFAVFLMAFCYFIVTRGGQSSRGGVLSSFSEPYNVIASSVAVATGNKEKSEKILRSIFYIEKSQQKESPLSLAPNSRLEVIISSPPDIVEKNVLGGESAKECTNEELDNRRQNPIPYLSHISSTTWVHDEELGRGYLLLADAGRSGRIWRWEVGGGPITIGRSLHMERSGCRSGLWIDGDKKEHNRTCPQNLLGDSFGTKKGQMLCSKSSTPSAPFNPPLLGSASLAVELTRNSERSSAGNNIIVAEWGERRIVRVEGESGARTPLVTLVPNQNDAKGHKHRWRRVFRPNHLTYTPFGDLLFSDNLEFEISNNTSNHLGVVYRRKEAVHMSPIPVEQSRDAHSWVSSTNEEHDDKNIDVLFQTSGFIEGMALGTDFSTLFVLVATEPSHSGRTKTVYKVRLNFDEDAQDSGDESGVEAENDDDEFMVFYEMNATKCELDGRDSSNGSKLAVDEKGTIFLIACPSLVTLLDEDDGQVVGTLTLDKSQKSDHPSQSPQFTSVSFGEDGYLYITSPNELMRIKSRVGGMTLPTNLVVPQMTKGDNSEKQ